MGVIVVARSTLNMSPEMMVISLPELVSVRDFIESTPTLSYIAETRVLRILTATTYPLKMQQFLKNVESKIAREYTTTSQTPLVMGSSGVFM